MKYRPFATVVSAPEDRIKVLLCLAGVLGAVGIFVMPWFVPFQQPIASLSYTFGFNNFAAWLAVATLLTGISLLLLWRRKLVGPSLIERTLFEILPGGNTARKSNSLFAAFLAVAVLGATVQIVFYSILPSNYWGEVRQHVSRLDLMILGRRPHTDFQYNFGPAMLYPAYALYRLGRGSLSIDAAYCTTLSAYWVMGTFLSYYVIKNLSGAVKRTIVFVCISLLFLHPTMMGLQYTPIRYFLPLASLVFIHKSLTSALRWRHIATTAGAFLLPLIALGFSPDAGISTTLAVTVYFLTLIRTPLRKFSYCALASVLAFAIALIAFGRDYLDSVRAYSSSVACFPIFPTVFVLLFLTAICVILSNLAIVGLRQQTPLGSLSLAFSIVLGLGIPPALGRCSLVYICLNGVGVLMFSLALLTTLRSKRFFYPLLCAYLLLFPLCNLAEHLWLGYARSSITALDTGILDILNADAVTISFVRPDDFAPKAIVPRSKDGDQPFIVTKTTTKLAGCMVVTVSHRSRLTSWLDLGERKRRTYAKPRYFSSDLLTLLTYDKLGTPFGGSEEIDRFLKMTDRYIPEYWPASASHFGTVADVQRKIRDLDGMDVILVPQGIWLDDNFFGLKVNSNFTLPIPDPVLQRKMAAHILTEVNMFPIWLPKAKNIPYYPEVQIMAAVAEHYVPIGEFRDYIIAKRR
jgi:hypothetical protein